MNNVKYIGWMLETVPPAVLDGYELVSMNLEYRRECGQSDVVQSMTSLEPSTSDSQSDGSSLELKRITNGTHDGGCNGASNGACSGRPNASLNGASNGALNPFSHAAAPSARMPEIKAADGGNLQFVHLLRMESDGAEIVRGRTRWRPKKLNHSQLS